MSDENKAPQSDWLILDGVGRTIGAAKGGTAEEALKTWKKNNAGVNYKGPLEAWRKDCN